MTATHTAADLAERNPLDVMRPLQEIVGLLQTLNERVERGLGAVPYLPLVISQDGATSTTTALPVADRARLTGLTVTTDTACVLSIALSAVGIPGGSQTIARLVLPANGSLSLPLAVRVPAGGAPALTVTSSAAPAHCALIVSMAPATPGAYPHV